MNRLLPLLSAFALGCAGAPTTPAPAAPVAWAALPKVEPKQTFKLPGERMYEFGVQLAADGKTLAVGYKTPTGFNWTTRVWAPAGDPKAFTEFERGGVFVLSPSGKRLLTSERLEVHDVASKKVVGRLPTGFSHAYFRDEDTVVAATRSYNVAEHTKGRVTVWDVTKNADAGSFDIPDNRFSVGLPARGGKEFWLFMSHQRYDAECYDVAAQKLARTVKPEPETPGKADTSSGLWESVLPDGSAFAASVRAKTHVYDGETGKILATLPADLWGSPAALVPGTTLYLARTGTAPLSAGFAETDFIVYDWKAGKPVAALVGHAAGEKEPYPAVSADGKTVVSVSKGGEGLVFDLGALK